jgi:uncharacterized protein (DUF1684 family)
MTELGEFRDGKDAFFKSDDDSPLTSGQKQNFEGLKYYPENERLRFEVDVEVFMNQNVMQMATSTGEVAAYQRWGIFRFEVDGQEASLTLYRDLQMGMLFLPFVDATAVEETYGSGRYLEPEIIGNDRIRIDFNLAYNPYCAYNQNWSCPIPPDENHVDVLIRAGEKIPSFTIH